MSTDYSDADTALILKFAAVDWEPGRKCFGCVDYYEQHDQLLLTWSHDIPAPPLDSSVFEACFVNLQKQIEGIHQRDIQGEIGTHEATSINRLIIIWQQAIGRIATGIHPRDAVFAAVLALQKEQPK